MSSVQSSGGNLIQLAGPMTLYESNEIRDTLLSTTALGRDITIDLETSGPWDLSGLQLLLAAAVTGRNKKIAIRLVRVPKVCVEIAERSGLGDWLRAQTDSFL